jgi:hypothetical protein
MKDEKQYPEGHFPGVGMAMGIAIFSGTGVALSASTGNPGLIGIGPAIGMIIGLSIGSSLEKKYKKEGKIRPLTEAEKKKQKKAFWVGIIILIMGIMAFSLLLLL